jgi:hypothetical protein
MFEEEFLKEILMATTLNFKDIIDLPEWRPLAVKPTAAAAAQGLCHDLRNTGFKDPFIWNLASTTTLEKYSKVNDEWITTAAFTALGGTTAAGAGIIFTPSHGPTGTVAGSPTPTSFTLAALPNSGTVGLNQLANAGDGTGYRIRVHGKTAGKTEERTIIANTASATPVITVDVAFSFTPTTSDTYEILSGRIYMFSAGTTASGFVKAYDVATGTVANISVTTLAATIGTDFCAVMLDERYVPSTANPGEGLITGGATYNAASPLACIQGTAADGTHITGSGMPSGLLSDEYKNFQIRIVEDTVNTTAVGQRRYISTHASGASAQFTISSAWSVTPSSSAKFVVENNNDLLVWTNAATVTYSYKAGGFNADAAWSTAASAGGAFQYANPPAASGAGTCAASCFAITPDSAKNVRHSHIIWFRGAGTAAVYYLDVATLTWSASLTIGGATNTTFTTGTCFAHDAATNGGKYLYINPNGGQRFMRFDLLNRYLEPFCYMRYAQGTAHVGGRLATATFIDGSTKLGFLYAMRTAGAEFFNVALQR